MKSKQCQMMAAAVFLALASAMAFAQLAIQSHTMSAGGGVSEGGGLKLAGTVGQHDAGRMAGGTAEIAGGFWPAVTPAVAGPAGPGDYDRDGDVDVDDYTVFAECLHGPGRTPAPDAPATTEECLSTFDLDGDSDVDLLDYAGFQGIFGT